MFVAKKEIIIIGAGAIGRGYLPWVFDSSKYDFVFVDSNTNIVNRMNEAGYYTTYMIVEKHLKSLTVAVKNAYLPNRFDLKNHTNVAAVFINVGPRHAAKSGLLVDGIEAPVILCENDPATVEALKNASTLKHVYFAVPDVITSNTSPNEFIEKDPLSVISEHGQLFVDEGARGLDGNFISCSNKELLQKQWTAKLYLHNTPHCVAAYLGALAGVKYVHEAMAIPEIYQIVKGSMGEMLVSLKMKWDIPHDFLEWYADKELQRFSCELLFDPISRVAREPLRKLELEGRLIGAAQICLSLGTIPKNILLGIVSALLFENEGDPDNHLVFMRKSLESTTLLTHVLSLRKGEALEIVLRETLDSMIQQLEKIRICA